MTELPSDLIVEIFRQLPNYRSVVALRLCSRQLNDIYRGAEQTIAASVRERITAPFRELYEFLVRLRLPQDSVLHPPPSGWPTIGSDACRGFDKTPFAVNVLKHLSYVNEKPWQRGNENKSLSIAYRSNCVNYSAFSESDFSRFDREVFWAGKWQENDPTPEKISGMKHVVMLAGDRGLGGLVVLLDTFTGTVFEEISYCTHGVRLSAREYCDRRMEILRNLDEIFIPGNDETMGARWPTDPYDAEALESQGEAALDGHDYTAYDKLYYWLRHLYRKQGWPGSAWNKEEGLKVIADYVERHPL